MGFFSIVVVLTFLLCPGNSSATTTVKVTDPTFTSNYQLFTESGQSGTHKRMLRTYESPENEDRVSPGTIMGAIKSSSSKLTETAKMNIWLLAKASGVYVLKSLQLGGNIQAVLKNKKLETLFEYVEKFNNGKPQSQQISVVGSLRTHYGDDIVMKALASARQVDETKDVAAKLETELFKGWIQKPASVDFAFSTLKIHDEGSAVLRIQKIEILENYITFLNANAKASKNENLVDALMLGYGGDRNLLLSLGMAKHDVLVGKKATELETAVLLEKVDRQRRVLQIKDGVTPVLSSEYLNKLERYISKLRATYKNNDVSLTRVLATKYGDERVAKSLVAAKYVEETKDVAKRLQAQQFEEWLRDGKSIDGVYDLLRLKQLGQDVIASRGLDTLEGYITLFNSKNSAHESFIKKVSTNFGGESNLAIALAKMRLNRYDREDATKLQNKLFQQWREDGMDSVSIMSTIFKVNEKSPTEDMKLVSEQFKEFLTKHRASNVETVVNPMRS